MLFKSNLYYKISKGVRYIAYRNPIEDTSFGLQGFLWKLGTSEIAWWIIRFIRFPLVWWRSGGIPHLQTNPNIKPNLPPNLYLTAPDPGVILICHWTSLQFPDHQNGFAFCKRPNFGTTLNWRGSQISNYLSQILNHLKSLGPKSLFFLAKRTWGLWIFSHELNQINQVTLCDAPQSPVWSPIVPRWSGLGKSTENCWNIRVSCRLSHPILVIVSVDKGNHKTQASPSPKLPLTGALIEGRFRWDVVVYYDPILNPQGLGKSRPEICLS